MTLNEDLMKILVCPACRGDLAVEGESEGLLCAACAKVYPIREGIPVMLGEESIALLEWRNGKREATGSRIPSPLPTPIAAPLSAPLPGEGEGE